MSIAWRFSRIKEQPTIFSGTTPRFWVYACPPYDTRASSAWYSKLFNTYRIYSGDGSIFYEFDDGFDYSSNWTQANDLPDPGNFDHKTPPSRGSLGPINPNFPDVPQSNTGSTITTSHEYWLPVGKNLLIYYFYKKRQTAFQFTTTQNWYTCEDPSTPDVSEAATFTATVTESPTEVVSVNEHCLLVGENSIKQLNAPTAFRDYLNARTSSFTMIPATGYVNPEVGNSWNGQTAGPVYYQGFQWQETPAQVTPPPDYSLWNQKRKEKFGVVEPFPGSNLSSSSNLFSTGYFISTAGGYRSIVGDANTDYDKIYERTPNTFNVNDSTGFGSGDSWESIFDNSTQLKFSGNFNGKKVITSSVVIAQAERPQDSLSYTTPEGFQVVANWTPQIVIGYDWANTQFCRAQLAKLGFTASDLTP